MLFDKVYAIINSSEITEKILTTGISLAKSFDIDMTVLYLVDTSIIVSEFPHHDRVISPQHLMVALKIKKQARFFLDNIKKNYNTAGVRITTKLIENQPLARVIQKAKRKDLIIIGHTEKSSHIKIFRRNETKKILRNAPSTVLIVK